ncbi:hypothetical protein SLEP1_g54939 [Rubroshorea leprosula]|uniref:MSP domain-containing protein n=1 Tax=Rubroshorea leprosula TaxID=152421 RepID=A0AAV5MF19_9ROSI|nr:hypothetical protein SLEP1_g54939 [Rubroshorea leprosula]
MDRLISLEPSNLVAIRIDPGQKCYGELTLRNVMYTTPVAFKLQLVNKPRYSVKPQPGIIPPLVTLTVEIVYHLPPASMFPDKFPHCDDSFLLHSVLVPGAAIKDRSSTFDTVPNDWFRTRKKQVFIDSGTKVMFVGSSVLAHLVIDGGMDEMRESRPDIVQLLLELEVDIELQSRSGSTPLEAAAGAGEALIIELLLAHKACAERSSNLLLVKKGADVEARTEKGVTPLQIAESLHYAGISRILVHGGAMNGRGMGQDVTATLGIPFGNGKPGKEVESKTTAMKRGRGERRC